MTNLNPVTNTLPAFDAPEGFVPLPLHTFGLSDHICTHCHKSALPTYAEYLADYEKSYEGPWLSGPYQPEEEELYTYYTSTCQGRCWEFECPLPHIFPTSWRA